MLKAQSTGTKSEAEVTALCPTEKCSVSQNGRDF